MKDKTHAMNRGLGAEEACCGYDKISKSEIETPAGRKKRQLTQAGLIDNEALQFQEDMNDTTGYETEGFLDRHNYHYRS